MGAVLPFADNLRSLVYGLGGRRDKAASLEWVFCPLDRGQLEAMYRGDWLARKVVDIIPNDMTREWRAWQANGSQIEKIEELEKAPQVNLQAKVARALQTARLYGGALLYVGIRGQDPAEELDPRSVQKGDLQYLHLLSCYDVSTGQVVADVSSPYFGQPEFYEVQGGSGRRQRIHPSRVVRFDGAPTLGAMSQVNGTWADSVLQAVQQAVKNATSAQEHSASMIPEAKVDVIYVPGLSKYASTDQGQQTLTRRFGYVADLKSSLGITLLDGTGEKGEGEKWEQKQIRFAELTQLMQQFLQVASGAADIPVTRLLGESPAGLNATGESDLRNYYDNIAARQRLELGPALQRLDEVLIRSATGARSPSVYYEWEPLYTLSEKEKAEAFKLRADAARAILGAGGGPALHPAAFSDALANTLIEAGDMPGLEAAIEQHGTLAEPKTPLPEPKQAADPNAKEPARGGQADADGPF